MDLSVHAVHLALKSRLLMGQVIDFVLIILSHFQNSSLLLVVFLGKAIDHSVLHVDDLVESLGLIFECLLDVLHFLVSHQVLRGSFVLHLLLFSSVKPLEVLDFFVFIMDSVL